MDIITRIGEDNEVEVYGEDTGLFRLQWFTALMIQEEETIGTDSSVCQILKLILQNYKRSQLHWN